MPRRQALKPMPRRYAVLFACLMAIATGRLEAQADTFFSFHSNPWMNLHHILWSKGEGAPLRDAMPEAERAAWTAGIAFYASYSRRDLLFDEQLIAIKEALRTVEARTNLNGLSIDSGIRTTLERLMPIYRKHWWPDHD